MNKWLRVIITFVGVMIVAGYIGFPRAHALSRIDPNKMGVFGIPNDVAANAIGATWTRYTLNWQNWDNWKKGNGVKPPPITAIESSPSLKIVLTSAPIHSTKTKCSKQRAVAGEVVCPQKDLTEYKQWVRDVVSAYQDKVYIWQLGNEVYSPDIIKFWGGSYDDPNAIDFLDTFSAGVEAVRGVSSSARIAAPGIAFEKVDFTSTGQPQPSTTDTTEWQGIASNFEKLVATQCANKDFFGTHLYRTVESIPGRVAWTKQKTGSCPKPILATEIGMNIGGDYKESNGRTVSAQKVADAQQAEIEARYTSAINAGVEMADWFYYQDKTGGSGAVDSLAFFGLVDGTGNPKPAYSSLVTLTGAPGGTGGTGDGSSGSALLHFIPSLTSGGFPTTPRGIVALIFRTVIALSGAIFLVLILISGIQYLGGAGNEESITKAKKTLINAVVGLFLVLSSYAFGTWILRALGVLN